MERKQKLINYVCKEDEANRELLEQIIDEALYLEEHLTKLKEMPFMEVHPSNPAKQRATPASKQYKELLQQYTNIIKILSRAVGNDGESDESPLTEWRKEFKKRMQSITGGVDANKQKKDMDTG